MNLHHGEMVDLFVLGCLDDQPTTQLECGPLTVAEDFPVIPLTSDESQTTSRYNCVILKWRISSVSGTNRLKTSREFWRIAFPFNSKRRILNMAGRFSGLHISLPGLGTILLRPSATTTRTTITSNLPPINQVSLRNHNIFHGNFVFHHGWLDTIELSALHMLLRDVANDNLGSARNCVMLFKFLSRPEKKRTFICPIIFDAKILFLLLL